MKYCIIFLILVFPLQQLYGGKKRKQQHETKSVEKYSHALCRAKQQLRDDLNTITRLIATKNRELERHQFHVASSQNNKIKGTLKSCLTRISRDKTLLDDPDALAALNDLIKTAKKYEEDSVLKQLQASKELRHNLTRLAHRKSALSEVSDDATSTSLDEWLAQLSGDEEDAGDEEDTSDTSIEDSEDELSKSNIELPDGL